MDTVYFITHPNVIIQPSVPVTYWPLSDHGIQRMKQLLKLEWVSSISSIYSSTERKALDGANILSEYLQLPITQIEELGENDRSSTGYLPPVEFEAMADQFFAEPSKSVRGWETAEMAQDRIVMAVKRLVTSIEGSGSIAIVSHGAVGTLLMCHLNNWAISREHDQPGIGGGCFFSFSKHMEGASNGWTAIDS